MSRNSHVWNLMGLVFGHKTAAGLHSPFYIPRRLFCKLGKILNMQCSMRRTPPLLFIASKVGNDAFTTKEDKAIPHFQTI